MAEAVETIGLENDKRSDFELRSIFSELFGLVTPCMETDGQWLSLAHEIQATEAVNRRFPEIEGLRLLAALATVASVRASGRQPAL